jgi:hypothetical protein
MVTVSCASSTESNQIVASTAPNNQAYVVGATISVQTIQ